ncbi:MAG TPA: hypothetical protein VFF64_20545 [Candidatus Eremiobacteraceae bacterium]|nr:hypothetical protein [Candidatus Eremiobacteraceae bacterium]
MYRRIVKLALICLFADPNFLNAQDFKILDRMVQVHGFASQGFIYTNDNNWLTMNTSQGSGAFTDFGLNMSAPVTDKFRVGAQVYDRNLGQLGQYHPSLDWAVADYRFKGWFGIRGGKVKTTLGLYNDVQDQDFLRTFALLPQSLYPADIRDATIAHLGGDLYGNLSLRHHLGDLSYTAYAGHRSDSLYSGIAYIASQYNFYYLRYGGLQYGGDLRWNAPLKGLLIGASRMNEDLTAAANFINPLNPGAGIIPDNERSKTDWTNQFYGEYTVGKLRLDSEYRRFVHDQTDEVAETVILGTDTDVRGWYVSGVYRVMKRLAVGSYYSRYSITRSSAGPLALLFPDQTDTSLPANHVYDKVISARVDLNRFWNVKVEGHFMNGYGDSTYPDGFYPQVNPQGFKPNTNALVIKTSFHF